MAGGTGPADLDQLLKTLKRQYGETVSVDHLGAVRRELLAPVRDAHDREVDRLAVELAAVAQVIARARDEIAQLRPDDLKTAHIAPASDELDAVVKATEEATETILDAAETLDALADDLPGVSADKLRDETMRIFQACSFQDLTGQRITKVVGALKELEVRIEEISTAFGDGGEDAAAKTKKRKPSAKKPAKGDPDEADLLNGPQLPDKAKTQADIDALFDD